MGRIEEIAADEYFSYEGDLHVTGSIGINATVVIKNGNLTVGGNIGKGSEIKMTETETAVVSYSSMSFVNGISVGNEGKTLHVLGNVDDNVSINTKSCAIDIDGRVGDSCKFKTMSGDITVGAVGNNTLFKTMSGDIAAGEVGSDVTLKTMSGDVSTGPVGKNSLLETMSGDIKAGTADESVTCKTMSGTVTKNGVKQRNQQTFNQAGVMRIGNMSFIGGTVSRAIVNGVDVTDFVNNANRSSSSTATPSEPVRYKKG